MVQTAWELPILIQWPESIVEYEFTSKLGDISFGVIFASAPLEGQDPESLEFEAIEEVERVQSESGTITGSFEVPSEGVVFFLWDNTYDWMSNKQISYVINVKQPSFSLPDSTRCNEAYPLMRDVVEELDVCYNRRADAQDCVEHNTANILFLEDQIFNLQKKLNSLKEQANQSKVYMEKCSTTINIYENTKLGLCIRSLDSMLLSCTLSYLTNDPNISLVCKYWNQIQKSNRIQPFVLITEIRSKLSKDEIKQILFDLKLKSHVNKTNKEDSNQRIMQSPNAKSKFSTSDHQNIKILKHPSIALKEKKLILDDDSSVDSDTLCLRSSSPQKKREKPLGQTPVKNYRAQTKDDFLKQQHDISKPEMKPSFDFEEIINGKNVSITFDAMLNKAADPISMTKKTSTQNNLSPLNRMKIILEKETHSKPSISDDQDSSSPNNMNNMKKPSQSTQKLSHENLIAHTKLVSPDKITYKQLQEVQQHHTNTHTNNHPNKDLVRKVRQIRNEQQWKSIVEYINAGYDKIEKLQLEKRKIKKLIKAWNQSFEKQYGRLPTTADRKGHLRDLHEEYHQVINLFPFFFSLLYFI